MKLQEWSKENDIKPTTHKAGSFEYLVVVVSHGNPARTQLWQLTDYKVQSVLSGNQVSLIPNQNPETIARTFSELLKADISESDMTDIIESNIANTETCATHDYVDANVYMMQAMRVNGIEFDAQDEQHRKLWTDAWNHAKQAEFFTDTNEFRR